jgi:ABC-2 type transport system permease protein
VTIPAVIAGGWPVAGSILFGLAQVGVGLSFAALTAIAVQLSSSYRACGAWIFGALGVTFILRMLGDVNWDKPGTHHRLVQPARLGAADALLRR